MEVMEELAELERIVGSDSDNETTASSAGGPTTSDNAPTASGDTSLSPDLTARASLLDDSHSNGGTAVQQKVQLMVDEDGTVQLDGDSDPATVDKLNSGLSPAPASDPPLTPNPPVESDEEERDGVGCLLIDEVETAGRSVPAQISPNLKESASCGSEAATSFSATSTSFSVTNVGEIASVFNSMLSDMEQVTDEISEDPEVSSKPVTAEELLLQHDRPLLIVVPNMSKDDITRAKKDLKKSKHKKSKLDKAAGDQKRSKKDRKESKKEGKVKRSVEDVPTKKSTESKSSRMVFSPESNSDTDDQSILDLINDVVKRETERKDISPTMAEEEGTSGSAGFTNFGDARKHDKKQKDEKSKKRKRDRSEDGSKKSKKHKHVDDKKPPKKPKKSHDLIQRHITVATSSETVSMSVKPASEDYSKESICASPPISAIPSVETDDDVVKSCLESMLRQICPPTDDLGFTQHQQQGGNQSLKRRLSENSTSLPIKKRFFSASSNEQNISEDATPALSPSVPSAPHPSDSVEPEAPKQLSSDELKLKWSKVYNFLIPHIVIPRLPNHLIARYLVASPVNVKHEKRLTKGSHKRDKDRERGHGTSEHHREKKKKKKRDKEKSNDQQLQRHHHHKVMHPSLKMEHNKKEQLAEKQKRLSTASSAGSDVVQSRPAPTLDSAASASETNADIADPNRADSAVPDDSMSPEPLELIGSDDETRDSHRSHSSDTHNSTSSNGHENTTEVRPSSNVSEDQPKKSSLSIFQSGPVFDQNHSKKPNMEGPHADSGALKAGAGSNAGNASSLTKMGLVPLPFLDRVDPRKVKKVMKSNQDDGKLPFNPDKMPEKSILKSYEKPILQRAFQKTAEDKDRREKQLASARYTMPATTGANPLKKGSYTSATAHLLANSKGKQKWNSADNILKNILDGQNASKFTGMKFSKKGDGSSSKAAGLNPPVAEVKPMMTPWQTGSSSVGSSLMAGGTTGEKQRTFHHFASPLEKRNQMSNKVRDGQQTGYRDSAIPASVRKMAMRSGPLASAGPGNQFGPFNAHSRGRQSPDFSRGPGNESGADSRSQQRTSVTDPIDKFMTSFQNELEKTGISKKDGLDIKALARKAAVIAKKDTDLSGPEGRDYHQSGSSRRSMLDVRYGSSGPVIDSSPSVNQKPSSAGNFLGRKPKENSMIHGNDPKSTSSHNRQSPYGDDDAVEFPPSPVDYSPVNRGEGPFDKKDQQMSAKPLLSRSDFKATSRGADNDNDRARNSDRSSTRERYLSIYDRRREAKDRSFDRRGSNRERERHDGDDFQSKGSRGKDDGSRERERYSKRDYRRRRSPSPKSSRWYSPRSEPQDHDDSPESDVPEALESMDLNELLISLNPNSGVSGKGDTAPQPSQSAQQAQKSVEDVPAQQEPDLSGVDQDVLQRMMRDERFAKMLLDELGIAGDDGNNVSANQQPAVAEVESTFANAFGATCFQSLLQQNQPPIGSHPEPQLFSSDPSSASSDEHLLSSLATSRDFLTELSSVAGVDPSSFWESAGSSSLEDVNEPSSSSAGDTTSAHIQQLLDIFHQFLDNKLSSIYQDPEKLQQVQQMIPLLENLKAVADLPGTSSNLDILPSVVSFAMELIGGTSSE